VPPPNIIYDIEKIGSNSSNRMNIIRENPPVYANIDPSNFDNYSTQPKNNEDDPKI